MEKRSLRAASSSSKRRRSDGYDTTILSYHSTQTASAVGWLLLLFLIEPPAVVVVSAFRSTTSTIHHSSPPPLTLGSQDHHCHLRRLILPRGSNRHTLSIGRISISRICQCQTTTSSSRTMLLSHSSPVDPQSQSQSQSQQQSSINQESSSTLDMDTLSYEMFKRRRDRIDLRKLDDKGDQQKTQQTTQTHQTPNEFVTQILRELRYPKLYPNHLSGVLMLLQSSIHTWRQILYKSIGCNVDPPKITGQNNNTVDETKIAQSLLSALSNINSQFGILVGVANEKEFVLDFPTEPVEYEETDYEESDDDDQNASNDSSSSCCWLECRVRDKFTDELLIVMGWTLVLVQKKQSQSSTSTSKWYIDSLDWQDFRDDFRPGIGREEWERICG